MNISVVIPAYNAEAWVATAIESCLNQTLPPHEIIVVDDVSKDRTVEIASSYSAPVRVVKREVNGGVGAARNTGAQASTGDWIAVLDADDWFLPEKLAHQAEVARSNPKAKLIYTGFRFREVNGSERDVAAFPAKDLGWMLRYRCPFHISSVMVEREAFFAIGGFDPVRRISEEWDFYHRFMAKHGVESFAAADYPDTVYRMVPGSLSSNALRFLKPRKEVAETRCLQGTTGLDRWLWRRRIIAFLHYDTGLVLREEGSKQDLEYVWKSLMYWPFPTRTIPMMRYKVLLAMLKQHAM